MGTGLRGRHGCAIHERDPVTRSNLEMGHVGEHWAVSNCIEGNRRQASSAGEGEYKHGKLEWSQSRCSRTRDVGANPWW